MSANAKALELLQEALVSQSLDDTRNIICEAIHELRNGEAGSPAGAPQGAARSSAAPASHPQAVRAC